MVREVLLARQSLNQTGFFNEFVPALRACFRPNFPQAAKIFNVSSTEHPTSCCDDYATGRFTTVTWPCSYQRPVSLTSSDTNRRTGSGGPVDSVPYCQIVVHFGPCR